MKKKSSNNKLNFKYLLFLISVLLLISNNGFSQINKLSDGVIKYYKIKEKKISAIDQILEIGHKFFFSERKPFNKTVAFLVGVSKYEYLPILTKVPEDILKLKDFFLNEGGVDTVFIAQENIVSSDLIKKYMVYYFPKVLGSEDRLLFYFSGHADDNGGNTGYMQFKNSKPKEFWQNTLAINESFEWCKVNKVKHLLLLFDCCSAGLAFDSKGTEDNNEKILTSLSGKGSRIIITAGDKDQKTYDGWFTSSLLNALNNSNELFITAHDIYSYMLHDISLRSVPNFKVVTPRIWDLEVNSGTFIFVNPNNVKKPLPYEYNPYLRAKGSENKTEEYSNQLMKFITQLISEYNKFLIIANPIKVFDDSYKWQTDLLNYSINNSLKSNNNYFLLNESTLDTFNFDIREYPKIQENVIFLNISIDSIIILTTMQSSESSTYEAYDILINISLGFKNGLNNEKVLKRKFQASGTSKIEIVNEIAEKVNYYIDRNIMNYMPSINPKIKKKGINYIWLDIGNNSKYNYTQLVFLDSIKLKPLAILTPVEGQGDSIKTFAIYGHRKIIKKNTFINENRHPYKFSLYLSFEYGRANFHATINQQLNKTINDHLNFYKPAVIFLFPSNFLSSFVGIGIGGFSNSNISAFSPELIFGCRLNIFRGFINTDISVADGIFIGISQKISDTTKKLVLNNMTQKEGWELENTVTGSTLFYTLLQFKLNFILDRKENFNVFTSIGYYLTPTIKDWSISYHTINKNSEGNYEDSDAITVNNEYLPISNYFLSNVFWSFGFEYRLK